MKKYILGTLFTLSLLLSPVFTPPAEAASLTPAQVSAIISLLQTLGVDQSVINNVQAALSGGAAVVTPPAVITPTHKLPPTGVTSYSNETDNIANASVAADTGAFPRQDARYNRPFDYTKIANDGTSLPATATLGTGAKDWACTKDNITGLVWEVKTTSGLRSKDNTYSWLSSNIASNGGVTNTPSLGVCQTTGRCDTEKYVEDINATSLCGYSDWRMPGVKELEGIADFSRMNPAIDLSYFPNTPVYSKPRPLSWWSGTASANGPSDTSVYYAWTVSAGDGHATAMTRSTPYSVRLVHGTASPEVSAATCQPNRLTSNPDSAYSSTQNDGTVTDTRTGLMWKRCSEGQVWENGTCAGTISANTWSQALMLGRNSTFVGYSDWRLPNGKELRSLVEECRFNPAINVTIFPATSGQYYWTSSPAVNLFGNTNMSWVVDFTGGLSDSFVGRPNALPVRLVRDVILPPVSGTAPTAFLTINGQLSVTNADPLVQRTWGWSSTKGVTYSASGNITGCENASQNGPQSNWKPWIGGTGSAANGFTSATPGAVKYGCTIVGTYNVTNAAGETTTGSAMITYRHSYSSSTTCTSWTYGTWGTCQATGTQTRTVIGGIPSGCTGGTPSSTQTCTYIPPVAISCTGTHPSAGNGVVLNDYTLVAVSPSGPANTMWQYGVGSCGWSCTSPMLQDGDIGCKNPAPGSGTTITLNNLSTGGTFRGVALAPETIIGLSGLAASGLGGTNGTFTTNSSGTTPEFWLSSASSGWTVVVVPLPGYKIINATGCIPTVGIQAGQTLNRCIGMQNGTPVVINLEPDTVAATVHLTTLSPSSGKAGTAVTINGSGFTGTNNIYMDNVLIDATTQGSSGGSTPTWISFVIPSNLPSCPGWDRFCVPGPALISGTHSVSVQNTNGTSNAVSFGVN